MAMAFCASGSTVMRLLPLLLLLPGSTALAALRAGGGLRGHIRSTSPGMEENWWRDFGASPWNSIGNGNDAQALDKLGLLGEVPSAADAFLNEYVGEWSRHFAKGHGICNGGYLRGLKEASQTECQHSCAGSECQYYCFGGVDAPKGACLLYTKCEGLFTTRMGKDLGAYSCYRRPGAEPEPEALQPAAPLVPVAPASTQVDNDGLWSQHLAPARGFCSSGFLKGVKKVSQLQCQSHCSESDDCQFYCHSGKSCLEYTQCDSLLEQRRGNDMTMYACFQKPQDLDSSIAPRFDPPRLAPLKPPSAPAQIQAPAPQQDKAELWSRHMAPRRGLCSAGYMKGTKKSSRRTCQSLCDESTGCDYFCHTSGATSMKYECMTYSECPSLLEKGRRGQDASMYQCFQRPTVRDHSVNDAPTAVKEADVAPSTSPSEKPMELKAEMKADLPPSTSPSKMPTEVKAEPKAPQTSAPALWPQHFAPATGYCASGFLRGVKKASKRECQSKCEGSEDCHYYCHAGTSCLQYAECTSIRSTRTNGEDMSQYICHARPLSAWEADHKAEDTVFNVLDHDQDGELSAEEFAALAPQGQNMAANTSATATGETSETPPEAGASEPISADRVPMEAGSVTANSSADTAGALVEPPAAASSLPSQAATSAPSAETESVTQNATNAADEVASEGTSPATAIADNSTASDSVGTGAASGRKCGLLWLYEIPGCSKLGTWLEGLRARGDVDEVLSLEGSGPGTGRMDEDAYKAFAKEHFAPLLNNPQGKLLAVRHGQFGPAPGGWLNKTLESMREKLQAQGCDMVRATFLRDPVERAVAVATNPAEAEVLELLSKGASFSNWFLGKMKVSKSLDNGMTRSVLNTDKEAETGDSSSGPLEREPYPLQLGAVNESAVRRAMTVLRAFEFVGFAENMTSEVSRLEAQLGFQGGIEPEAPPSAPSDMTASVRDAIGTKLSPDTLLYERAKSRFSQAEDDAASALEQEASTETASAPPDDTAQAPNPEASPAPQQA